VRAVAAQSNIDISAIELVNSEHSEDSAAKAVEFVTAGKVEALMKGSLHTDELMGAVVSRQSGIRTARRIMIPWRGDASASARESSMCHLARGRGGRAHKPGSMAIHRP
jgi:hypothetical protein